MRQICCNWFRWIVAGSMMVALLVTAGCGSKNPPVYAVKGKVTYPDGSPVQIGTVEFEPANEAIPLKDRVNARALINEDGTYELTTFELYDGALPGPHRVIVQEPPPDVDWEEGEKIPPPKIDKKYRAYTTSGLSFEVKEEENVIDIEVTKP